jgi:exopolysaccharide biosynthesis polyprenyl glycosylphosphotransferase
MDASFRDWQNHDTLFRPAKRTLWQDLLATVLPQPSTPSQRLRLAIAILADILGVIAGFTGLAVCRALWQQGGRLVTPLHYLVPPAAMSVLILYGVVFTLLGYSERLYQPETAQVPRQERLVLAKVFVWSTSLVVAIFAVSQIGDVPLGPFAASAPVSFLIMLAWREQWRQMSAWRGWDESRLKNALIVGAGKLGRDLASYLEQNPARRCIVRGFLDEDERIGGQVQGRPEDLARVARSHFVDEVILTISPKSAAAQTVIREARRNRIDVKVVPDLFGFDPAAVTFEKFGGVPVLTLCEESVPSLGLMFKRAIDLVLSAAALVLVAPLLAGIAIAIKLDTGGPVLYRATRVGRKGRRFLCCKFRTMVADADKLKEKLRDRNQRQGAFFKIVGDPRITRVGRILRRYSLDELPQLWNVLRGEMSLVGPRPHPVDDVERYELEDLQRLEITPGLTGLWQVMARSDPSFERGMALDREYIGSWSLWMDFKILCRTALVVVRGEGI